MINSRKALYHFKKIENLFIQEAPTRFHLMYYVPYSCVLTRNSPLNFVGCYYDGDYAYYVTNVEEVLQVAKSFLAKCGKDKHHAQKVFSSWKKLEKEFYLTCNKIDSVNLDKLSLSELASLYQRFHSTYVDEYGPALLSDPTGYHIEKEILSLLSKLVSRESKQFNQYLSTISCPTFQSFLNIEQYQLFRLALFLKNKYRGGLFESNSIEKIKPKLHVKDKELISKHADKYHWIQNNYYSVQRLDSDHFLGRIKKHLERPSELISFVKEFESKPQESKKNKERLMKELNFSSEYRLMIQITDLHGYWQDLRKRANLCANYYIRLFLDEASRRFKLDMNDLYFTTPNEFSQLLGGDILPWKEIRKRAKGALEICLREGDTVLVGKEKDGPKNKILDVDQKEGIDDFRGVSANIGKVVGRARIILNPKTQNFPEGEIFIASMTRPEYTTLMKKALAVVTNEGGMTCHAAIVDREFGIPCIVGTVIATKVIKNGDLIEVDANHGVIRILERKK